MKTEDTITVAITPVSGSAAPKKARASKSASKAAVKKASRSPKKRVAKTNGKKTVRPASGEARADTKKAIVLEILRRKQGATTAEIAESTEWQNHSIRGFISGHVTKKMGLAVDSSKNEAGERHHASFEYKGAIHLVSYELHPDRPSHFEFTLDLAAAIAASDLETELLTHGAEIEAFVADEEGRRKIKEHISYERSAKNRARALEIHGTSCLACGFNFDEKYGSEFASQYIEVHHVDSVARGPNTPNPETDLIPLCSNCHSMAHRRRGQSLSVEQLRHLIQRSPTI